jgi:fucose permease
VLLFSAILFCQSGNEFTMGGWISSFLTRETAASAQAATLALAGYWLAMMLGRLGSAALLRRISSPALLTICGASAAAATGLLLAAPSYLVGAIAAVWIGFSYSAIYPTTLGLVGDRFPRFSGTVFGVVFTLALIGGMVFPWLAGHLAVSLGLRAGLSLPLLAAATLTMLVLLGLRKRA